MSKQVAVLGLGKFGSEVARQLAQDGCEVLAGYHRRARQELAAREYERRATRYATERRLAEGLNSRPA